MNDFNLFAGKTIEFCDVQGYYRPTRGCSIRGKFEFSQRLTELKRLLAELSQQKPGIPSDVFYDINPRFKFLVDRCLELNFIKPEWCSWQNVVDLLFYREEDGQILQPWLVELNFVTEPEEEPIKEKEAPQKYEEIIAAICSFMPLSEALRLVGETDDGVPANMLMAVLKEIGKKAESSTEEGRKRQKIAKAKELFNKIKPHLRKEATSVE